MPDIEKPRELTEVLDRLAESNLKFVSSLSHDFKTPLTVIKLYADFMMNDLAGLDVASQHQYLSIIKAGADNLDCLLANAYDFQKISLGKMDWHDGACEVASLLAKAVRPFEVTCQTKGIAFVFESDVDYLVALIDADRLGLIVYNLLANALKFTQQGGIKISFSLCATTSGKNICLMVSDSGRGMSEEQLQMVMATGDKFDGMGLYVVRHIVEHYQGRLWAESRQGEGSVFHVELPLREPELEC